MEGRAGAKLQTQTQQRSERGKPSVASSSNGVRAAPGGPGGPAGLATRGKEAASDAKGELETLRERERFAIDKSDRVRDIMLRKLQRARRVLHANNGDTDAVDPAGDELQQKEPPKAEQEIRPVNPRQGLARLSSFVLRGTSGFATTITPCACESDKDVTSPETPLGPPAASEFVASDEEHGMEMSDWKLDQILLEAHQVEQTHVDWGMVQKMFDRSERSRRLEGAGNSFPEFCGEGMPEESSMYTMSPNARRVLYVLYITHKRAPQDLLSGT